MRERAVLAAAISVMDAIRQWPAIPDRFFQRRERQLPRHPAIHGMADDSAGRQVFHARQVQPPFVGSDVGNIAAVHGPRIYNREVLIQ